MNNEEEIEPDERRTEIERREAEAAAEAERMLENTGRFLDQLSDSPPESRRYVAGLKEHLENEVRHQRARRKVHHRPSGPDCRR